jgi:nucleotidyltransferase substrate binding protein (TIGR01987 family)
MFDIRWLQRLQNFKRANHLLQSALEITEPSQLERAGIIQFYEMAFELAWKTLKDYLEEQGFETNSPRQAIKQGFQSEIIKDGHSWIKALEDRNLTVHTYDEAKAIKVESDIRQAYAPLINNLIHFFESEAAK